jgi:hypothetical protein
VSVRRKILLSAATVLVLLLATLFLAPILLRDKIEARVKAAIAENVNARVDWRDADVGLLRTFPNHSIIFQSSSTISW